MPITFTCPHCGKQTEVDDRYAGQSGPCANCGETVSIPATAAPEPNAAGQPAQPPRKSGMSILVIVLVAALGAFVVCGGALTLLLLPAVQTARESARRVQCANNLKQLGIAMHNYVDIHRRLPPAHTLDEDGKPMHSWRVMILRELGRADLYDRYNFDEPWDSPANQELADEMPSVFACPSSDGADKGQTSYVMIVGENIPGGENFVGAAGRGTKFSSIRDGSSRTILLVEATGRKFNWLEPVDLKADEISFQINDGSGTGICSDHPGCVNVLFCDGAVYNLPDSVPAEAMKAMATKSGNEPVDPDDFVTY